MNIHKGCYKVLFLFSDPHIKVTGLPEDVREAKDLLLAVLDTKVIVM